MCLIVKHIWVCPYNGFIASKNSLYRELNRGVEWVFTNDALKLQAMLSDKAMSSRVTPTN
jgi:hypothetical protein